MRINRFVVGITGASGSVIAKVLLGLLAALPFEKEIYVTATDNGLAVFRYETGENLPDFLNSLANPGIKYYNNNDLFAPIASGSFAVDAMFVVPCSMATLGKIAACSGGGLICRAADVCLKERVRLIICPRESPLNSLHLRNMLALSDVGAIIAPPVPAFYSCVTNGGDNADIIRNIASRLLKAGGVDNNYYDVWKGL